jgi:signal transduction histidine kinase
MEVVERLIQRAAFRSEAALSAGRILFCLAFGLRFFGTDLAESDSSGGLHRWLIFLVVAVPIAFSLTVLHRFMNEALDLRWLAGSVLLDATISTAGLATNVLYPGSLYRGILAIPDTAGLLVIMMAAGLRLSVRLAALGIATSSLGLGLLIVGDFTICPRVDLDYSLGTVLLWPVFIIGAGAFALLSAWRARSLATHGALESARLERARHHLTTLLHGHHDAHAVLASATLNSDLLLRDPATGPDARRLAEDLRQDLAFLKDCVHGLKQRADGELINTLDTTAVSFDDEVRRAAERLSPQLGAVRLVADVRAPGIEALIAGGAPGLRRILQNLLLNARDATGERRTSQIWLETFASGARACLTIRDDGPGFPAAGDGSTKLEGMGVGLSVVAAIAEASGGSIHLCANRPHGAQVEVRLPMIGTTSV